MSTPAWVMVKLFPAMVMVAERDEDPELALTVYATEPLPEPLEPEVTCTQLALHEELQVQPDEVTTLTVSFPPEASKLSLLGLME